MDFLIQWEHVRVMIGLPSPLSWPTDLVWLPMFSYIIAPSCPVRCCSIAGARSLSCRCIGGWYLTKKIDGVWSVLDRLDMAPSMISGGNSWLRGEMTIPFFLNDKHFGIAILGQEWETPWTCGVKFIIIITGHEDMRTRVAKLARTPDWVLVVLHGVIYD